MPLTLSLALKHHWLGTPNDLHSVYTMPHNFLRYVVSSSHIGFGRSNSLRTCRCCVDPSARSKIHDIELVQNSAVRFISNLKRCTDSVSKAENRLQLQSLEERRKNHRLCFLTQILQSEDQHCTLSAAYDEIAKDRQLVTVTTHSAAGGEPISICTKKSVFDAIFLLQTIRQMRGENNNK